MVRMIIDTDAGVDDAQAIIMALTHPGAQVEAITTVTGNVHVDKVIRNVLTVLEVLRQDVPVYRGADRALLTDDWQAEAAFHGEDGLGNLAYRPPLTRRIETTHAVLALIQLADMYPGELTLVALGPLTNLALAARLDPTFPGKLKELIWMGGTIRAQGNTANVTAEWNIFCDPEAAQITLSAFPASTMLSWETTLDHPLSWEQFDTLCQIDTPQGRFFRDISLKTVAFLRAMPDVIGYLLPDPLAMAIALEPDIALKSRDYYVAVELNGAHTRGQTVVDYGGMTGHPANVCIVTALDIGRVYQQYERMLTASLVR
ncbi:MAG: nucleoside hydrolase [Anaerolineaceae bacterium]|nr:nucleoside hydrolase [Anaerolineaceae bacterium]